jgi:hypothetical protein
MKEIKYKILGKHLGIEKINNIFYSIYSAEYSVISPLTVKLIKTGVSIFLPDNFIIKVKSDDDILIKCGLYCLGYKILNNELCIIVTNLAGKGFVEYEHIKHLNPLSGYYSSPVGSVTIKPNDKIGEIYFEELNKINLISYSGSTI